MASLVTPTIVVVGLAICYCLLLIFLLEDEDRFDFTVNHERLKVRTKRDACSAVRCIADGCPARVHLGYSILVYCDVALFILSGEGTFYFSYIFHVYSCVYIVSVPMSQSH